ncbi:MAG TPA: mammalian cell entry protein, partial [Panacibacter sp.]|nr:mammalian cell entry protein [Panacibacter sp.]
LDTVLRNFNTVLDPNTKGNLQSVIANLNKVTASLVISAASLPGMLNEQSGTLAKSLNNVNSFTKNLADNNDKVTSMISNIEKTTDRLSKADIDGAINQLKNVVEKLNDVMAKINSKDGTLGALINEKELYTNLNNTITSANILMDDLRAHPKRYVNISVFGKKDKGDYLTVPLKDTITLSK